MPITRDELRDCASLAREVDRLKEQILRLRARIEGGSLQLVKTTGKGDADPVGTAVSKIDELCERLGGELSRYLELSNRVDAEISGVDSVVQRVILRLRYVDGLRWRDVSEKAHFSVRWCRELCARGRNALGVA